MKLLVGTLIAALCLSSPASAQTQTPQEVSFRQLQAVMAAAPPAESTEGRIARLVAVDIASREAIISLVALPSDSPDRARIPTLNAEINRLDAENTEVIRPLIRYGRWLKSGFNRRTIDNIWLLVQHSPDDDLMAQVLSQIEPLVATGQIDGQDYGLMFDRVAISQGRPQRYGTQFECTGGVYVPSKTEDPAGLDARRKQLGFSMSYEAYKKTVDGMTCEE